MEGALHELAEQFTINRSTSKSRSQCKSIRTIAKEWGVPRATLQRYYGSPGFFESGATSGATPVLTKEDETSIVKTILKHASSGMCLNHAQVTIITLQRV